MGCPAFTLTLVSILSLVIPQLSAADQSASSGQGVLFIIADDASRHFGEASGCRWVHTPNIDRLSKNGLVFHNAYTPTSKCAPSRAAILTGRNPWQLQEAANHQPYFPAGFMAFTEVLAAAGISCRGAGKTWGPGDARTADGSPRDFALGGPKGGAAGANARDEGNPGKAFAEFLKERPPGAPFFYWFGSHYPHRAYKRDSGLQAGKSVGDIDRVPAYWPDNDVVRRDMLDYAVEVEAFDAQVGSLLKALEESGAASSTLIIVTSDHGMPFPRVKGHTYDDAHHVPLVASWPAGIVDPGRSVDALVSFVDLAPTMLEFFGVDGVGRGMSPMTGRSFVELLRNKPQADRSFVIFGRERNDVNARPGSPAGLGYPVRAIREGQFVYIHNFEPDRWPCGNPDMGLKDTDASPTKELIESRGEQDEYWQHAFGRRPAEQLFNVSLDPDCVKNLAGQPEYATQQAALRDKLMAELRQQQDPRVLGRGSVFNEYLSPRAVAAGAKAKNKKKNASPDVSR